MQFVEIFENAISFFFKFLKKSEIRMCKSLTFSPVPSTNAVFILVRFVVLPRDVIFINFVVSRFPNFVVANCN